MDYQSSSVGSDPRYVSSMSGRQITNREPPMTYSSGQNHMHHSSEQWGQPREPEYVYAHSQHPQAQYKRSYGGETYAPSMPGPQSYHTAKRAKAEVHDFEREGPHAQWRAPDAYYNYSSRDYQQRRTVSGHFNDRTSSYRRTDSGSRFVPEESRTMRQDHSRSDVGMASTHRSDVRMGQNKLPVVSETTPPSTFPVQSSFHYGGKHGENVSTHEQWRDERNDQETIIRTTSSSSDVSRDRYSLASHEESSQGYGASYSPSRTQYNPTLQQHQNQHRSQYDNERRIVQMQNPQNQDRNKLDSSRHGAGMSMALLQAVSEAQDVPMTDSMPTMEAAKSSRMRDLASVSDDISAKHSSSMGEDDGKATGTGDAHNASSSCDAAVGITPGTRISGRTLLALPEDRIALSEALCIIRENVEVFRASPTDVDAPAPGRKNPVVVGQVGLRCIHCCNSKDRVKRAVCYPSSIRRIYRTITDMKLDHFGACVHVPQAIKTRLDELKVVSARSTGTTMRYFVDSAKKLGMADASNGIRFQSDMVSSQPPQSKHLPPRAVSTSSETLNPATQARPCNSMMSLISTSNKILGGCESDDKKSSFDMLPLAKTISSSDAEAGYQGPPKETGSFSSTTSATAHPSEALSTHDCPKPARVLYTGRVSLSLKEDRFMLSPLRCFLRENVYVFSASEEDIAARTPTNFSVVRGQVGICCMHCYALPPKDRTNRAVCFPFSIDRIYQSVADMQRFHFNVCKEVPEDVKEKFKSLKSASSKGSKGLATRQYWITSAKKLGLIDSQTGIRFGRDPLCSSEPAISLDILAQAALDLTKRRPLVLPEDRPLIAEFLYVVMQQLQPCQFTEADRNKRRMKEVGCIGVECKHCVGQAESRKFFWSSVNAVESNFISVHTHLMECKWVPKDITDRLADLKLLRKEQTARLKSGSQKAFFARVWDRLHSYEGVVKTAPGSCSIAVETTCESSPQVSAV